MTLGSKDVKNVKICASLFIALRLEMDWGGENYCIMDLRQFNFVASVSKLKESDNSFAKSG